MLPNAEDQPTVDLWPTAGSAFGLGRSSTYAAAARGEIPGLIKIGGRRLVSTADSQGARARCRGRRI